MTSDTRGQRKNPKLLPWRLIGTNTIQCGLRRGKLEQWGLGFGPTRCSPAKPPSFSPVNSVQPGRNRSMSQDQLLLPHFFSGVCSLARVES